jgi:hypothetical protein
VRRFDLPPMAVGQPQMYQLTPPHRGIGIYTTFSGLWLAFVAAFGPTMSLGSTLAERRLESVGNPAGRRVSRPGPGMAHDGGPRIQTCVRAYRA